MTANWQREAGPGFKLIVAILVAANWIFSND